MNQQIRRKTWAGMGALLVTAVLLGVAAVPQGQEPQTGPPQQPMSGMAQVDEAQASAMMAQHQQMMAAMHAMDQTLDGLIAKMDAATGADKTDAIAAVVKELVAQRRQISDRMMTMHTRMMGHMMQHMMSMPGGGMGMMNRGGQAGPMMKSLQSCPLMQGLAKENPDR